MNDPADDLPPDDVLRELGRLTFEAIRLEDAAGLICDQVRRSSAPQIGNRIREALDALDAKEMPSPHTTEWLRRVQEVLEARHKVMHGVPVQFLSRPEDPSGRWSLGPAGLQHIARLKKGQDPGAPGHVTTTMLSAADLGRVADQIRAVRDHWVGVLLTLIDPDDQDGDPRWPR